MKKYIFLIAGIVMALLMSGCGKEKYKLNFDGGGFETKKTEYAAGAKVTVRYDTIGTDTDYSFWIDEDVDMKQDFDGGYVFTFTMPAHDVTMHVSSRNSMMYIPHNEVWPYYDEPVSLSYERMWEYSAHGESDDADLISEIIYALSEIKVLDETQVEVEDYTDILTFTFANGAVARVEFEADSWVDEYGNRYETEGIDAVRDLLNELIED